jgi:DNA-binding transcriptional ArsR family regulator
LKLAMKSDAFDEIELQAERQAGFFKALGSPQRVLILWLLMEREMTLSEIASAIRASQQSTSRHLNILDFNKLVESRRERESVFYRITDNRQIQNYLILKNKPQTILNEINQNEKEKSNVCNRS